MATKLGDITLNKQSGTTITLHTKSKYVPYDGYFTISAPSAVVESTSSSVDTDIISGGTGNISGVIGEKTNTQPSSGYYIKMEASSDATPSVSTAGWVNTGDLIEINDTATKYFPVTAATITQNVPTVNSSGLVTATTTTTAGYTPANATAASNTLQLSTQAAKTVSPTESEQTAVASGKYTTGIVKVGAISPTYVGSEITRKDSATYTPTTTDQTIAQGTYLTGAQTIKGDANLLPENIKEGVSIFGVTGTYSEGVVVVETIDEHGGTIYNITSTNNITSQIMELAYPVGSLYATESSSANPSTTLGFGTWTKYAPKDLTWNDADQSWNNATGTPGNVYVWKRTA